ncbi:MAG: hypothetical protein EOP08_07810, partial [Proteobacteria bacterium]
MHTGLMEVLALAVPFLVACGAGGVAHEARPAAPKGASAGIGTDLLVDLPSTERAEIELALRNGAFAVRVEGDRAIPLPSCRPQTSEVHWERAVNGRVGTRPRLAWTVESLPAKHEIVKLRDASSLRAALPRTATALGADIEAELERGASLDLALVSRSRGKLEVERPYLSQITGSWPARPDDACRRATHLVTGVTFGAFAMATVADARESTAASIFGAGASSRSKSAREATAHEGDLADCDAGKDARGCAVPIRWTLTPIDPRHEARAACEDANDTVACGKWLLTVVHEGESAERTAALAKGRAACRTGSLDSTSAAAYACEGVVDAARGLPRDEVDRAAEVACLGFLPHGCAVRVQRLRDAGDHDGAFLRLAIQCRLAPPRQVNHLVAIGPGQQRLNADRLADAVGVLAHASPPWASLNFRDLFKNSCRRWLSDLM